MPTTSQIKELKDIVKRGFREPDKWFDEEQAVAVPIGNSDKYWRSIRVQLLAYAYGLGDEDDEDEPEFIVAASIDGANDLVHEPQSADPPEVGKKFRVIAHRRVLLHQSLDDQKPHEFFVSAAAFDSDSDTAWAGVVEALRVDLKTVGSAAIGSSMLAGFRSPSALMDFVLQHAGDAATDDPEAIGSQEVVLDVRQEFRRPPEMLSWTGHKWTLFSSGADDPWYLALWRIELDSRAGALAMLNAGDRATDVAKLSGSLQVTPMELAAARVLMGESREKVGKAFELKPAQLTAAVRDFVDRDSEEIDRRLVAVALAEQRELRKRFDA
jgi:hypothetical protein